MWLAQAELVVRTTRKLLRDGGLAARRARLSYVASDDAGILRKRHGKGFVYLRGKRRVKDAKTLERIRALAIPPAWSDVRISASPNAHIQATGRDARGRKQYRYHASWRKIRDRAKYQELVAFGKALPKLRRRVRRDLSLPHATRDQVLAMVISLMEKTAIRVGNDRYTRENGSYGLTTLRRRHIDIRGPKLTLRYRAKGGVSRVVELSDSRLARAVRRSRLPGQRLFQYIDEQGRRRPITAADVNEYLARVTGQPFTAKEFRTWTATIAAAHELSRMEPANTEREQRRAVNQALDSVSERLGNTRAVCQRSYVYPLVISDYEKGALGPALAKAGRSDTAGLRKEEHAVLRYLQRAA
jgi:DNA topoisomerase I